MLESFFDQPGIAEKHGALLSNLGISRGPQINRGQHDPLLKSQAHADLLATLLRQSGNTHAGSHAPGSVHTQIERSSKSPIDRDAERRFGRTRQRDRRDEDETLDRMSRAREQRDVAGCSLSKSINAGSFERMRRRFQSSPSALQKAVRIGSDADMAAATLDVLCSIYAPRSALVKAQPSEWVESTFEQRYGAPAHVAQAVGVKAAPATAKPTLAKSITKPTVASVKGSLSRVQAMVKSLGLDGVGEGVTPIVAQPHQYTAEQIEAATAACLAAGKCTASHAATINTYIAMGSMPPPDLMACLTGEACQ